jgi:hypothetical protein
MPIRSAVFIGHSFPICLFSETNGFTSFEFLDPLRQNFQRLETK